jgi:hypothetical protein
VPPLIALTLTAPLVGVTVIALTEDSPVLKVSAVVHVDTCNPLKVPKNIMFGPITVFPVVTAVIASDCPTISPMTNPNAISFFIAFCDRAFFLIEKLISLLFVLVFIATAIS